MSNIPLALLHTHHSSYNHTQLKQIIQEQTDIQSQHCLAQPLAQAEGSRSGEASSLKRIPLRLGEGSNKSKKASRDLAQARPLSPGRVVCSLKTHSGRLGDHSRRKLWASQDRLGESISVCHCSHLHNAYPHPTEISKQFKRPIAVHKLKQTTNHNDTRQSTPHEEGLASLTWNKLAKRPNTPSTPNPRAQQLKERMEELKR